MSMTDRLKDYHRSLRQKRGEELSGPKKRVKRDAEVHEAGGWLLRRALCRDPFAAVL